MVQISNFQFFLCYFTTNFITAAGAPAKENLAHREKLAQNQSQRGGMSHFCWFLFVQEDNNTTYGICTYSVLIARYFCVYRNVEGFNVWWIDIHILLVDFFE